MGDTPAPRSRLLMAPPPTAAPAAPERPRLRTPAPLRPAPPPVARAPPQSLPLELLPPSLSGPLLPPPGSVAAPLPRGAPARRPAPTRYPRAQLVCAACLLCLALLGCVGVATSYAPRAGAGRFARGRGVELPALLGAGLGAAAAADARFVRSAPLAPAGSLTPGYAPRGPDDETLIFESRFESGNLAEASRVAPSEYDLRVHSYFGTTRHNQWFFFRVANLRPNVTYRFNILNLLKSDSLYAVPSCVLFALPLFSLTLCAS
jgi:hypothetical protein